MAKDEKDVHSGTDSQLDSHVHSVLKVLNNIESHLASMVYYQQPSRGFGASIEKALAQPFTGEMNENKDNNVLKSMIREEVKKALGDK